MTAYIILDIEVNNVDGYEEYKKLAPASIEQYGGKYIVRGGKSETLEGDWSPSRIVVLQFDSVEQAKKWLESPEYSDARKLRHQYAKTQMVIVEGL